jgi:PAS domain S-box-containing protein
MEIMREENSSHKSHKPQEAHYQILFNNHPHPMWICDVQTLAFLEVNQAALANYGYSRSEFLAINVLDLQTSEHQVKVLQSLFNQQTSPDYCYSCEAKHRKKDGTIIDVEIDSHALNWFGRLAICILAKDISNRKSAENILHKINKIYRLVAAFNQTTNINEIYEVAIDGITDLLNTNRGAIAIPDASGIPRYIASVGISEPYKRAIEAYLTSTCDRQEFDTEIIPNLDDDAGDRSLAIMRHDHGIKAVASFPIRYQKEHLGKIIVYYDTPYQLDREEIQLAKTIANYLSISINRKQTELALLASESRFRTLVDNLPGAIYRCYADAQWTVLFLSESAITISGYPASTFKCRRDCIPYVFPEDRKKFSQIVELAIATRQPFELEYRWIHADGNIKWLYEKGQGFWDNYGNLLYLDGAIFDISDRKASELKLQESLHEKEVLLKEIHHRVKNNLQIVFGLLELQARSIHDPHIKTLFEDSQNRIHSMALIHEMLYRSSDLSQIDFATYLQDLLHSLAQSYNVDAQRISFQVDIETFPLNIELATPCGLIVNELVTNALKHAFPNHRSGSIKLACHKSKENRVCLIISDNGIGISADLNISKIKSLGLQLVYTLTKQLKGTIILDRSGGTTFQLEFNEIDDLTSDRRKI